MKTAGHVRAGDDFEEPTVVAGLPDAQTLAEVGIQVDGRGCSGTRRIGFELRTAWSEESIISTVTRRRKGIRQCATESLLPGQEHAGTAKQAVRHGGGGVFGRR